MGRTISNQMRSKSSDRSDIRKNKKTLAKKKGKYISKWGKHKTDNLDSEVDSFVLQSGNAENSFWE